jgi:hypothetical protein
MNEPARERPIAEELLAQQRWPADSDYADYRRRLDQALETASLTPSRLRLFAWPSRRVHMALALVVAACVLLAVFLLQLSPDKEQPQDSAELVVLPWDAGAPPVSEAAADVVALATVGKALPHGQDNVIGLNIGRLLKGRFALPQNDTPNEIPTFCCRNAAEPAPLPDFCREGAKVVVFLKGSQAVGWKLLEIRELPGESEGRLVQELEKHIQEQRKKMGLAW